MKQTAKILCFIIFVMISCKNRNDNNIVPISKGKKIDISDTSSVRNREPDNFLIDNTSKQDNGPVYMYCENMPEFPGGDTAFTEYVKLNVKYPRLAVSDKIEGRVVIKFIVRVNGKIEDVEIIRRIRPDMDNECIRVISGMPEWKPGMINEKPVSVSYNITIRFLLKKSENLSGIYILPATNKL